MRGYIEQLNQATYRAENAERGSAWYQARVAELERVLRDVRLTLKVFCHCADCVHRVAIVEVIEEALAGEFA